MVTLSCRQFPGWLTHNVTNCGMGYLLSHVYLQKISMRIPFQNNTGMSQIIYIFMLLITTFLSAQLLLTMCLTLVSDYISWNTTFTTIVTLHQISTGPLDLFFLRGVGTINIKWGIFFTELHHFEILLQHTRSTGFL